MSAMRRPRLWSETGLAFYSLEGRAVEFKATSATAGKGPTPDGDILLACGSSFSFL